ncbi:MAG: HNH endonuclease [Nanoarchaeota archaeon]|nr:HNH endonuclease [Nanoarchaeota archaeon]
MKYERGKNPNSHKPTQETKDKIKAGMRRPAVKKKMSEAHKGNTQGFQKGNQLWKKNGMWQGGIWNNPYSKDWTDTLRDSIRQRDEYVCQECGLHQDELKGWMKRLDVHHIDYDKENCDPKNLISLCRRCHNKTNLNREYWTQYFESRK